MSLDGLYCEWRDWFYSELVCGCVGGFRGWRVGQRWAGHWHIDTAHYLAREHLAGWERAALWSEACRLAEWMVY